MNTTIEQVREEKKQLEEKIASLIDSFEKDTDVTVTYIDYTPIEIKNGDGTTAGSIKRVEIDAEI